MATHLAARLVWHDRGWDGRICNAPKENGWCIRYEWVHENRRDNDEAERAGKAIAKDLLPPCMHDANAWGRSHDVKNLFIVDGSIWVTSGGVNPTSTIQALALYVADSIKQRLATLFD